MALEDQESPTGPIAGWCRSSQLVCSKQTRVSPASAAKAGATTATGISEAAPTAATRRPVASWWWSRHR